MQPNDIGGDPIHRRAKTGKTAMDNREISPGEDEPWLIFQRGRKALDEIEQTLSARLNMNAVLDIVGRPITLSGGEVALVE